MDTISILFAKIAGLQKSLANIHWSHLDRVYGHQVEHLIIQFDNYRKELVKILPELYSDLPLIALPLPLDLGTNYSNPPLYNQQQFFPIIQNIDYILKVRANYRIGEKNENEERQKRIFISHGHSKEWYKVQSFIEKDLKLSTLELAQEANLGRTVLQKLSDESSRCSYAVIVMTGDDITNEQVKARENVMHEIGYFQGKYGLQNIVLLYEEGVNIPSNIHGLVYIPFPKDLVEATLGGLSREIKATFHI